MENLFADALGAGAGNLIGNPATIVAGIILSRHKTLAARFWIELVVAVAGCVAIQYFLTLWLDPLAPDSRPISLLIAIELVSIAIATVIFKIGRKLRARRYEKQELEYARQEDEIAQNR